METFGTRIKHARERANLTQEYVAQQLNMTQQAYHKIESGKTKLDADKLVLIAKVIGVQTQHLIPDSEEQPVPAKTPLKSDGDLTPTERDLYERLIAAKNEIIMYLTIKGRNKTTG